MKNKPTTTSTALPLPNPANNTGKNGFGPAARRRELCENGFGESERGGKDPKSSNGLCALSYFTCRF
jgi:hypothetical protein